MEQLKFLIPLRRWWWLIVSATLVATASSFIATRDQQPIYQARVKMIIGRAIDKANPRSADFLASMHLGQTYSEIADTLLVRENTMSALGMAWLPQYEVRSVRNTELLEIIVSDTVPQRAQAVANELANQLILQSPTAFGPDEQERQQFISGELDDLQARITETKDEIQAAQDEIKDLVGARQIQEVEARIGALQSKLNTLQGNYGVLLANTEQGAINTLSVVDPAGLPTTPIGPNSGMTIMTAAAIGFVLAVSAAYVLEFLDNTIKNPDDINEAAGLPTLSGIAWIKAPDGEEEDQIPEYRLIAAEHPRSPISEAYRVLRTGIQFASLNTHNNTLLLASARPSEGKSSTAANLGVVMAQAGKRVLIVDADLRRPVQHKIFGAIQELGLTRLLLAFDDKADRSNGCWNVVEKYVQKTKVAGLSLITSGPIPPNPSEMLDSITMRHLLDMLSDRFDTVILDSPPVLAVTDAVVLGSRVGSVLLVVDAGKTRRQQLKQCVDKMRGVNANLVGVVLNRVSRKGGVYGYYYYYQYEMLYYIDETQDQNGSNGTVTANGRRSCRRKRVTAGDAGRG